MSETLCRQWRSRSSCVWRTSKINPGTSGRNIFSQVFLCSEWWTGRIQPLSVVTGCLINTCILILKKGSSLLFIETYGLLNNIDFANWSTGCCSLHETDVFLTGLLCCSATDALKGEGLQEGVDWLQGRSKVKTVSVFSWCARPTHTKSSHSEMCLTNWSYFSFYHLHCFHSHSSIDQMTQWVLCGGPVLRSWWNTTVLCVWPLLS